MYCLTMDDEKDNREYRFENARLIQVRVRILLAKRRLHRKRVELFTLTRATKFLIKKLWSFHLKQKKHRRFLYLMACRIQFAWLRGNAREWTVDVEISEFYFKKIN